MVWSNVEFEGLAPEGVERTEDGYWRVKSPPSPEDLAAYYAKRYYQEARGSYEQSYSAEELRHIRGKIALRWTMVTDGRKDPGRLLDVGCGEGFVLAHGAEAGWDVRGLDFSDAGLRSQNPRMLDRLTTGDLFVNLENEIARGERYEVVWLQNVLEHVIDPLRLLERLKNLTMPGGRLVVTVPNDFSRLQHLALTTGRIDRNFWVALPDHLSYFSADSLRRVSEKTGWSCRNLLADFPVDWFLFNDQSNYVADPTKGKSAHHARIALENLILEADPPRIQNFFESLADMGMGRDLTAFLEPV